MSWIEKELQKRKSRQERSATLQKPSRISGPESIERLWERIVFANKNLPVDLQLETQLVEPPLRPIGIIFQAWLRAPNGAAIGYAGDAIRYFWPKANARRSNNFWIRWNLDLQAYVVVRRLAVC